MLFLTSLLPFSAWSDVVRLDFDKIIPPRSDISFLLVEPETNTSYISHQQTQLQPPASLQKLLTALAASLYLGKDYQYETRLELKGEDVIIQFGGDPTLKATDLENLFVKLAQKVNTIKGNIYINGAAFDMFERPVGLPWDILGICYSAPSSSITLDHNCANGRLSLSADERVAKVTMSSKHFIKATAKAIKISNTKQDGRDDIGCDLTLLARHSNHYELGGCIDKNKLPMKLNFAIQDTESYAKKIISSLLNKHQLSLQGQIIRDDTKHGNLLAQHYSKPMSSLLKEMLQDSDNLIADNVLKTLGAQYYRQQGSYSNGVAALKRILKEHAEIELSDAVIVDGSGLSRNNRLTAEQMMQVIKFIFNNPQLQLQDAIPVSGKTGTLRYRRSVMQLPLKGRIQAKTGSLFGTFNLAGVINTHQNKNLLFVQILTNYHSKDRPISTQPVMLFEKKLYQQIYQQY